MEKIVNFSGESVVLIDTIGIYDDDNVKDWLDEFTIQMEDDDYVVTRQGLSSFAEKDSKRIEFSEWLNKISAQDFDDFWENLRHTTYVPFCVVTGELGLWDGYHTIYPKTFKGLYEAINACTKDAYDIVVKVKDNVISVENHHHDGTNYFEIRIVNYDNYDKIEWWDGKDSDLIKFIKENAEDVFYEFFGI